MHENERQSISKSVKILVPGVLINGQLQSEIDDLSKILCSNYKVFRVVEIGLTNNCASQASPLPVECQTDPGTSGVSTIGLSRLQLLIFLTCSLILSTFFTLN